jgi:Flp pilus assembly pilin Flp
MMDKMFLKKFLQDDQASVATEYLVLVAAAGFLLVVGVSFLFSAMSDFFSNWAGFFGGWPKPELDVNQGERGVEPAY